MGSPREAVQELGISVKTGHRRDQAGKLHTVRTTDHQRRIPIEETALGAWEEQEPR
ncbi:MAG: hypothetical protein ACJ8CB_13740 [Ktedonobacteraceae bacterium]